MGEEKQKGMNHEGYKDPTAERAICNVTRKERRRKDTMRNLDTFGRCKSCGSQIMWIRTKGGKNMPVDPEMISYKIPEEGEPGTEKLVLPTGEVLTANRAEAPDSEGIGYISHFATCPNAKRHRRR